MAQPTGRRAASIRIPNRQPESKSNEPMRTDLALRNILHNLPRTAVALGGIGIAILLIFMQLGFRGAVENTATTIYDQLEFDLIVRSPSYLHFVEAGKVPARVVSELQSLEGVVSADPFHVTLAVWLSPLGDNLRGIMVMGVDPEHSPFRTANIQQQIRQLRDPRDVLMDTTTNREFGPLNGKRFSTADLNRTSEISGRSVRIAGLFELGAGLTANGSVLTSEAGFRRIAWSQDRETVSFVLVRLAEGLDRRQFQAALQRRLQGNLAEPEVEVLTRDLVIQRELQRWIGETPVGFVFTLGVLISLVVGGAIFYMVLSTDVSNRLAEFATLKAMGYSDWRLSGFVLWQAIYLGLFAFVPSLVLALICYRLTESLANLPIEMNWQRVLLVFVLTQLMCNVSGLLALRKLYRAEPAALF